MGETATMNVSVAPHSDPLVGPSAAGVPATASVPDAEKPIKPPWRWMTIAMVLLGGAIGVRHWQEARFTREEETGIEVLPFDLETLPMLVGPYRAQEGLDARLDPATVRYAGGLKSLLRTYTDESTGVRLMVLVLYGRADSVVEHVPELCYNGAGYGQISKSDLRDIKFASPDGTDTRSATFMVGRFQKALAGGAVLRDEAYHSFRYRNRWSTENPVQGHNRRPIGIFKIQVQRKLGETEYREDRGRKRGVVNPTEEFLAEFLPAFEAQMAAANVPQSTGANP